MSQLSLSKLYGDLTLLFKSDIDTMWTELEAKVNGNLDQDNIATGTFTWDQVTLDKDTDMTIGATESGLIRFYSADNELVFAHDTTARNTIFMINTVEIARVDSSANFKVDTNVFFYNRNTTYGLVHLLNYQKPVLVYVSATTIRVEQNTGTANQTLIVFPAGPIAVVEDTAATHKFRMLTTSATANGYISTHTGAADSGMRVGLTLAANTWYFVYAVVVNYGDDAGDNFILVGDDTSPAPANWSTLDTRYGAGMWVYLGLFRRGFGSATTTTVIPFVQDHQGWHTFTETAAANMFFGICMDDTTSGATTYASGTVTTFNSGNSGDAVPATCSLIKGTVRVEADADLDMMGGLALYDGSGNPLWFLPSFGNNLTEDEAHGFEFKIPNAQGITLRAAHGSSGEDFLIEVQIAAVLDEWA